jgi:lipoprotein-anchoring transpeptidase ErfK/SrfK
MAILAKHLAAACLIAVGATTADHGFARELTAADVNAADFSTAHQRKSRAVLIKEQVLLDRAGFSSGVIDGRASGNFANALRAFQEQNGLETTGEPDEPTWSKLGATSAEPVLINYVITRDEASGPFAAEIPDSMEKMVGLKRLAYTGPVELLAEKFHMDEDLLEQLNPGRPFDLPGTVIVVANVNRTPPKAEVTRLEVNKGQRFVRAFDRDGKLVGFYPASIGSDEKPAPTGTLKITRVVRYPVYYYSPRFNFAGVKAEKRLKIAPGPNNPVGSVWMNLNARTYGIHGTAEPEKIGKTSSHGCVRLTNWDARALAAMVKKGTTVAFQE